MNGCDPEGREDVARVILKRGRDASLKRRHPWLLSGAVASVEGAPVSGDTVDLVSHDGQFLARGAYSPQSQFRVRVWTFDEAEAVNADFLHGRLRAACASREHLLKESAAPGCRLVNAESDGLPGLIVDRYAGFLVCQFLSAGVERWKREIVDGLKIEEGRCRGIFERSDTAARKKEGLPPAQGVLRGEEPPELVEIEERGCRFGVALSEGQKTGFYLDQREARGYLLQHAADAEMLNCFAYTGAFAVCALKGGAASVLNVESSAGALAALDGNIALNGLDAARVSSLKGNAFQVLRKLGEEKRSFDLVVIDPPKFVESRNQLMPGCRGYKDINRVAFKLVRPGGRLVTFSCSGLLDAALFQKVVADAALDAGREAKIIGRLNQPEDHPVTLAFPEGRYLKGLICRVV